MAMGKLEYQLWLCPLKCAVTQQSSGPDGETSFSVVHQALPTPITKIPGDKPVNVTGSVVRGSNIDTLTTVPGTYRIMFLSVTILVTPFMNTPIVL